MAPRGAMNLPGHQFVGGQHQAAPDDDQAHKQQIAEDIGADRGAIGIDQYQRAENAAGDTSGAEDHQDAPVNVAMQDMRGAGSGGGEQLRGMDAGRGVGGRHAGRQQHHRGDDAVAHAERAVDQLGEESDQGENQKIHHRIPPGKQDRLCRPTQQLSFSARRAGKVARAAFGA